jgi:serine/threonine protein phosphatase PrpC
VSERGRRRANEDAVVVVTLSAGVELAAVADGMGGYAGGEVASRRALEVLRASLDAGVDLTGAVQAANAAVFQEATHSKKYRGMGTTLVALLRRGAEYTVVNVGDSRAYRIDDGGIQQLTHDHSFVADAIRGGQLTAEDAEKSRWRNAVTRAIGTQAELDVDTFGPFNALEPHTVVLCSDGLYRGISDEDLRKIVTDAPAADMAARALAAAAYQAGSDDNISVVLLRFGPDVPIAPPAEPLQPRVASAPAPARSRLKEALSALAPAERRSGVPMEDHRNRRYRRGSRWTLLEILLIFLGIIVLTFALLRVLPF